MDTYNRDRGIARLRKAYKTGCFTKSLVNKRGYNKFLEISKDIEVVISEEKIAEECQWDGLKGYITNTDLDAERVIAEYHRLFGGNVHSVFYFTKTLFLTEKHLAVKPLFDLSDSKF